MRARPGQETGASGVEVGLLLSVVALAVLGAVSFLGRSGDSSLDEAGRGIDERGAASAGPAPPDGGGGTPGGPTGPTTPTPTTAPPTTMATTTTTAAPTTTTTAPTTTTTRPVPASASLSNGRGTRSGSSRWDASAELRIATGPGIDAGGTATVQVRTQRSNGQWSTTTIQVPLDASGNATIATGPYARTGSSRIMTVQYTVLAVELDGPSPWDGDQATISVARPS